jgi:hypothetical protein
VRVTVGLATTVAVFVADNPVEGVQLYVFAPDAVKETDEPVVIDAEDGETEITGKALTVTVATELFAEVHDPKVTTAR